MSTTVCVWKGENESAELEITVVEQLDREEMVVLILRDDHKNGDHVLHDDRLYYYWEAGKAAWTGWRQTAVYIHTIRDVGPPRRPAPSFPPRGITYD